MLPKAYFKKQTIYYFTEENFFLISQDTLSHTPYFIVLPPHPVVVFFCSPRRRKENKVQMKLLVPLIAYLLSATLCCAREIDVTFHYRHTPVLGERQMILLGHTRTYEYYLPFNATLHSTQISTSQSEADWTSGYLFFDVERNDKVTTGSGPVGPGPFVKGSFHGGTSLMHSLQDENINFDIGDWVSIKYHTKNVAADGFWESCDFDVTVILHFQERISFTSTSSNNPDEAGENIL
jgi:hypothetical protein